MFLPGVLCHYYDASTGPFRNLSDLPAGEAEAVQEWLRQQGDRFASHRSPDYLAVRKELESRVRAIFVAKGGQPLRPHPHYLTLGPCPWLLAWYPNGRELRVKLTSVDPLAVSFTYGDTFPAMRYQDGKPYRGKVYLLSELPELVQRFGLPQEVNPDGKQGPDRYIEAQVWQEIVW